MIGFQYLSKDHGLLLLDYFGNNQGIDLIKLETSSLKGKEGMYAKRLKEINRNK